jgi:hypothetical protein
MAGSGPADVVAAWALGLAPATIAEQFALDLEQVLAMIADHRASRPAELPSSPALQRDALEQLDAQMERLTLLASQTSSGQGARVAAVRTWRELWRTRLELLERMGNVTTPGPNAQLAALLGRLRVALRDEGVPDDVLDRAAARVIQADVLQRGLPR